jgi:hypothetical protein
VATVLHLDTITALETPFDYRDVEEKANTESFHVTLLFRVA